jgi:hypothetical protein
MYQYKNEIIKNTFRKNLKNPLSHKSFKINLLYKILKNKQTGTPHALLQGQE